MRITLLTMGKTDIGWVAEGLEMYSSRLSHYVPFSVRELPELKGVGALSPAQIKAREGECLLKAVKPSDFLVLLDEHGAESAGRDLVFVVGGAYGFAPAVYERADSKLSLSRMTCSHQLVRTVFAEQLYRAFTILRGEPYHNE